MSNSKNLTVVLTTIGQAMGPKGGLPKGAAAFAVNHPITSNEQFQLINMHISTVGNNPYVYVYYFPNNFDGWNGDYASCMKARYSYNATGGYDASALARTKAVQSAFGYIYKNYPATNFGLKEDGHGSFNGMFAATLHDESKKQFLTYCTKLMKQKFAFFDWSTNCGKGSNRTMQQDVGFVDYILASEFEMGGGWDYNLKSPDNNYPNYWKAGTSILDSLKSIVTDWGTVWNAPTSLALSKKGWNPNSMNLYDMNGYQAVANKIPAILNSASPDLESDYGYIPYVDLGTETHRQIDWYLYLKNQSPSDADTLWSNFNLLRVTNDNPKGFAWSTSKNDYVHANGVFTFSNGNWVTNKDLSKS